MRPESVRCHSGSLPQSSSRTARFHPGLDKPRWRAIRWARSAGTRQPARAADPSPSVEAQGSSASREDEEGTADEPDVLPEMDELGPACGGVVGDRPVGMADRRGTEIEEHQEEGEVAGAEAEDQRDPARDLEPDKLLILAKFCRSVQRNPATRDLLRSAQSKSKEFAARTETLRR
jgi:hypothetical protein